MIILYSSVCMYLPILSLAMAVLCIVYYSGRVFCRIKQCLHFIFTRYCTICPLLLSADQLLLYNICIKPTKSVFLPVFQSAASDLAQKHKIMYCRAGTMRRIKYIMYRIYCRESQWVYALNVSPLAAQSIGIIYQLTTTMLLQQLQAVQSTVWA